jgi:NADH-quinone oxidoreductase subunit E
MTISRSEILARYHPVKDNILIILHDLQNNNPLQYLSQEDILDTAKYLKLSLSSVYGVVSYYSMFSLKPRTKYIFRICKSPVCEMDNADNLFEELKKILATGSGNISADGLFTVETSECLGHCEESPGMMINDTFHGNLDREILENLIQQMRSESYEK